MAHQAQLANVKYRNWVKAGLGIKYVKEGLEPFCAHLATQQHIDILNKVKQTQNLSAVSCGHCDVRTLLPHQAQNKPCPLGQDHCNCQYPKRKSFCPNNVCGAIYDEIIQLHSSTPPAPYWRNTDARQWCTEPWSVAKCFINAPGYEQKSKVSEFDCPGLLHLLINNKGFQQHIKCAISGKDVFSRVRKSRNEIFHSHTMELEDNEVNSYIDDMIELLEDETEIKHRQESKAAVIKLQQLKQTNFAISTADEDEVVRIAIGELQQTKVDAINEVRATGVEGKRKLEGKMLAFTLGLEQKRKKMKKESMIRENKSKKNIEQKGIEIKKELTRQEVEAKEKLNQKLQESKLELEGHKHLIECSKMTITETRKEAATDREGTEDMVIKEDEYFLRASSLLLKGGRLMSKETLYKELRKAGGNLDILLKQHKRKLKDKFLKEQRKKLFPDAGVTDVETWDLAMLTTVSLTVFKQSLNDDEKNGLKSIKRMRDEIYAYTSSLSAGQYEEIRNKLQKALTSLSNGLSEKMKGDCFKIIQECTTGSISPSLKAELMKQVADTEPSLRAVMNQKNQNKFLCEMRKDLMDKLNKICATENRNQRIIKVIDTELTLSGAVNESKKIDLAEKIITTVINRAKNKVENENDFPRIRSVVKKILKDIENVTDVEILSAEQKCILLKFRCTTYLGILNMLMYLESRSFLDSLNDLALALSSTLPNVSGQFRIDATVTPECLEDLLDELRAKTVETTKYERTIRVPIKVESVQEIERIWSLFETGEATNRLNELSKAVSDELNTKITFTPSVNLEQVQAAIKEAGKMSAEVSQEAVEDNASSPVDEDMAHKSQFENKKYWNWVKAGLGFKYVKDGLKPFCEHLVNQQHTAILSNVKWKHNLSAVSCGLCEVHRLQPDHIRTRNGQCPLGQIDCNCQHPTGKISCPYNVCGAIYDQITQRHASTPPAPNWRNTDAKKWCTEPWSIAKCFVNAPGYEQKSGAAEFDLPGFLHLLMNNVGFQQHIKCVITGRDVFSRVRKARKELFNSNSMELDDTEVNSYIDDMTELLEDEKEIKHREESKMAVKKLQKLKKDDFIISTTDEAEIRRVAIAAINQKERKLKQTIVDATNELRTKATEGKRKLGGKGLVIKSELEQKRKKIRQEMMMKKAELEQTGQNIKKELRMREDESKKKVEMKRIDIEKQLTKKRVETEEKLEHKLQESKAQLESHKNTIESSMTSTAETNTEAETSKKKADFQEKLVKLYKTHIMKVPPLPRLHKDRRNVSDIYVSPWMTVQIKDEESKRWKELKISTHQLFRNDEKPAKYIYVIGEAGSGKTTFCKMLVHFWCIAHPYQECSLDERDIHVVEEMKRFNFLFYVSLRHFSDRNSIEEMLKKSYSDPALGDILQNESCKCLIILDGLDEWDPERKHSSQFLTPGLPGHGFGADYTIITTTRQWKFDALPISDSEVDKKIKLNGIDRYEMRNLTKKTVEILNDIYQKCKNADECIFDLERRKVSDISHTPLVLQQLVCLWFNDKLRDNSMCDIYKSMLECFFEWKILGTSESQNQLYAIKAASRNAHLTKYLSYLAYDTLFDKNKETTLTQLDIPSDVIKDCLASGIIKEERIISFSESIQSSISFFHKSMQEYLAAEYIASQFREMLKSQKDEHDLTDVCEKCVRKYFGSCKTAVDILEQSNVLIILCGLEPRLLTNISEYFYNVTIVDKMMVKERNKEMLDPLQMSLNHHTLINDIQTCILKCIEEVMSITKNARLRVYIADLHPSMDLLHYGDNIVLKNVLSIEIVDREDSMIECYEKDDYECYEKDDYECYEKNDYEEKFYLAVKHLVKCDQLKVIKYTTDTFGGRRSIDNEVTTILERNVRTLETIHLSIHADIMITRLVSILPKMRQLISLQVNSESYGSTRVLTRDDFNPLCKFLEQTTSLQHISLNIYCSDENVEYMIDLSKHKQLQHVDFMDGSFRMVSCNTDNLETCKLSIERDDMMKQVCDILYKADKLKHLELYGHYCRRSCETDTESLIRLLLSLASLSTLTLGNFIFTDNIIARDMKNLKKITLRCVRMSMTTWCKFIDSLPELPQVEKVTTSDMNIRDGTIYGYSMLDEKQEATARQYVREKTNLFRVTDDYTGPLGLFGFTTKK
ncbi:uncharacterized protein LOC128549107 [Mercenaria mercenaria]|uniref:uncharacterized protein LOC128549107 n=1 Tax=Mercenaria mercenaria TaxID=6596 RepID=UPI00234ECEAE|nr:uncharacterized protein LOC128549107 [Mercenaria mercenaria]XP_053381337.1 uncharacterized protein LOC128549107 [Mercenaria mercenaria]